MTVTSITCESRIQRVTVYARGAVVTRRLALPPELPEAAAEITVKGVTAFAEPGSIRAFVDGGREVVALRSTFVAPPVPTSPGAMLERVRDYHLERVRLKNQRAHLKARRDLLSSVSLDPGMAREWRRVDPTARVGDAIALSGLLSREIAALDARVEELDGAVEKAERARRAAELAAAQAQSGELEGEGRVSIDVLVRLAPGSPASVRSLDVEYVVWPARWFPAYAARFSAGATRVEWSIEALVAQASGEDWSHVELALSTADLVTDARLPELASLRLGKAQPPARRGYRPAPEGLDVLFEGHDRFVAAQPARPLSARGRSYAEVAAAEIPHAPAGRVSGKPLLTKPTPSFQSHGTLYDLTVHEEEQLIDAPERMTLPSADAVPRTAIDTLAGGAMMQMQMAPPSAAAPMASLSMAPELMAYAAPKRARGGRGAVTSGLARYKVDEGGAPAMWEQAAPTGVEPADAWLDFDALILKDPDERASRGRLVREDLSSSDRAARDAHAAGESAHAAIAALDPPPYAVDPRESRGQFDHRYDAESLGDIPSNGRPHRVSVALASAPASLRFITVPREALEVYREVEIKNPFQAPLLAGPVEVFVDGALLTQSSIAHIDQGGVVFLGLGVEDRLRVARNARVEESSAGLLGGSTLVEHAVSIDLASSLGHDLEVTVIDRVPVSDDKDIEIKTLPARPAAEAYSQAERGQPVRRAMRWQVPVPAGGKARVEFGYRITLPSKSELVGGNRREG